MSEEKEAYKNEIDLETILASQVLLDEQNIPDEGRMMGFMGKDGNIYTIGLDGPADKEAMEQMPDEMKKALTD